MISSRHKKENFRVSPSPFICFVTSSRFPMKENSPKSLISDWGFLCLRRGKIKGHHKYIRCIFVFFLF